MSILSNYFIDTFVINGNKQLFADGNKSLVGFFPSQKLLQKPEAGNSEFLSKKIFIQLPDER